MKTFTTDENLSAALRGNPSFVWRAGQERRLAMIRRWARVEGKRVLVNGCGVGMYVRALQAAGADQVHGLDIERERVEEARDNAPGACLCVAACEHLPYADHTFDVVLSHEVLEHVADDWLSVREMVRVCRAGGRIVIFTPNRFYPFETHGHFWRGRYHFGNTPLINYFPDPLRNWLAPHVRAYTPWGLRGLFAHLPVKVVHHSQVFPGYDNIMARRPELGQRLLRLRSLLERGPLRILGLSHLLVVERCA